MNLKTTVLGELNCRLVDELPAGQAPKFVAVLCHGFGAPGTDLVGLGPELLQINSELQGSLQFVFPEAPLTLDELGMPGGRAWWMTDVGRFQAAIEQGRVRELCQETPAGLPHARSLVTALLDELQEKTGLPISRFVVGGFSQGAMVATDIALRLSDPPAGLCVYSGSLVSEDEWRDLADNRQGLPVLQCHGRQDPVLPFVAAEWLNKVLVGGGMDVEFAPFDGMHTISMDGLQRLAAMLGRLASAS